MRATKHYENFIGGGEGTEFEWDIFGAADTKNPEYQKELERVTKPNDFVFYRDALKLAKKFQPGDPGNPKRAFARDLRIEIIDLLGLTEEKDMDRIKFYTAIGTPLDKWHSIDGFFEIEQEHRPPIMITFDTTTLTAEQKQERGQKIKADILISDKELDISNEKTLPEKTTKLAKEIVNIFKEKQEQTNKKNVPEGKYSPPRRTV
ncbi:MAG: hypothetical protein A3G49_03860 [Candidatus Sungbacteria bacterium RIFCSPLOWO2_12_FULL_41_11]|uniref:Uncharacterized protein n=1 Tax=Candidatus Sungbacteria bacterium RIFCSPLOWO2_12_FULL_41_11 TaxID=1802286 RepID=A0A1G2LPN9_9BACT|nr:MAG: hypothetical protein UV01_C0016G0011 [Parcubacteria group bacterium GW2011_GWA2_42_14]OHA00067.1 MAG: hypothetical protein A3D41_03930 [Candidatus Sungbacteria bacterium RIFCSPHIGHO2_02_FULL_41_12b]OHA12812.1 MAG: hypothetical protein A3G49_03860 [Candidatus Sungbacteria bacterium RIFCSPLOWO2_12_FULL_41_11]